MITNEPVTREDLWEGNRAQQMMMHDGTAYIVRVEPDGTRTVWRSLPPQFFVQVGTVETHGETLALIDNDFRNRKGEG